MNKTEEKPIIELEEVSLEELIVLGDHKKIPIKITYPKYDGEKFVKVHAKALIRQLTLKEMDAIGVTRNKMLDSSLTLLERALFKQNGESFTEEELLELPLGVVNAIGNKIFEISGVEIPGQNLKDF